MTDLRQLSDAVDRASERGIGWCLATLYRADGSSYRRPGACMVVAADGSRAGAISGGCLEAEVAEHALRAVEHGFP
ncbi:MAG TPA: XdhC family protein, partial [Rhodothermales bacterium]